MATCIGGVMFATAVMAAPSGYLRKLGPVPLRFQSVIAPTAAVSLPPLTIQEKPVGNSPPAAQASGANSSTNTVAVSNLVSAASMPDSSNPAPSTNVITIANIPEPVTVTRTSGFGTDLPKVIEMLMPTPGITNAPGNKIVVLPSVPFTPPLPFQPAPSSATYSSPPDAPINTP